MAYVLGCSYNRRTRRSKMFAQAILQREPPQPARGKIRARGIDNVYKKEARGKKRHEMNENHNGQFEETHFVGVKLSLHNGLVHGAPLTCFFNVVAAIACSSVIVLSQKTAIHNTRILKGRAHGLFRRSQNVPTGKERGKTHFRRQGPTLTESQGCHPSLLPP